MIERSKAKIYDSAKRAVVEMGYSSLSEALQDLDRLKGSKIFPTCDEIGAQEYYEERGT
jgi:hypothetical protein